MTLQDRASRVRLLLLDVDGVLTNGKILLHADGSESKLFDIKDGTGVVWARRSGLDVALLSARTSASTSHRAAQLGIVSVIQGVSSKLEGYNRLRDEYNLEDAAIAYMGDDILDLPVVLRAGLSAAPADAVADVRSRVHFVARAAGGDGAVRELVELILKAQGRWDALLQSYIGDEAQHDVAPAVSKAAKSTKRQRRAR